MHRRRFLALILVGITILSSSVLQINVWGQAPEKPKIAFRTRRNGLSEIFLMDIDGKNLQNLTKGIVEDGHPTWSPNGKQIAFWSKRGNGGIYVMDADGNNVRLLTDRLEIVNTPAWSPDGQAVAFWARPGVTGDIYVIDANGRNVRWLTVFQDDQTPTWSPDGRRIAFTSLRDANPEIYVMDADGRNQQRLTHNRAPDSNPAWFDPRFARAVASMGRKAIIWGGLKQLNR